MIQYSLYVIIALLLLLCFLIRRNTMATGTTAVTLLATATTLATAANSLAATVTAIQALISSLQSGQLISQAQLDSVNDSLASSLSSVEASQTALQALAPSSPTTGS